MVVNRSPSCLDSRKKNRYLCTGTVPMSCITPRELSESRPSTPRVCSLALRQQEPYKSGSTPTPGSRKCTPLLRYALILRTPLATAVRQQRLSRKSPIMAWPTHLQEAVHDVPTDLQRDLVSEEHQENTGQGGAPRVKLSGHGVHGPHATPPRIPTAHPSIASESTTKERRAHSSDYRSTKCKLARWATEHSFDRDSSCALHLKGNTRV